jgi:hypothetical protein
MEDAMNLVKANLATRCIGSKPTRPNLYDQSPSHQAITRRFSFLSLLIPFFLLHPV